MKKLLSLTLALLLLLSLVACKNEELPQGAPAEIRVWTLNGTTGFGMAQLMHQKESGAAQQNYVFTVESTATNVRDALINGTADIAALPTNLASAVYNATNGGVKILAINTGGVLYLVTNTTNGASATALTDLSGKTVYCPAQNPAFKIGRAHV